MNLKYFVGAAAVIATAGLSLGSLVFAQGRDLQPKPVAMEIKDSFDMPAADSQTRAIVAAAETFLATLDEAQRTQAVFAFDDAAQRGNWSNFPHPVVERAGVMRGDMNDAQRAALDALLAQVLSPEGVRNVALQLRADDIAGEAQDFPQFGSDYYFVSFLGDPSTDAPWMLQFGGHHLAINATIFGSEVSFSPMLTGGEPLHVDFDGQDVWITEPEVMAAQALLDSLSDAQRAQAVRSSSKINLLLGPGQEGIVPAPEGLAAREMSAESRDLLVALIEERLGFANADDASAKMAEVAASLDDTYFGWWGPQDAPGTAYYRVTGAGLVIEYAPQDGGSSTDHAHNMYRDPSNDYGSAWVAE